MPLQQIFIMNMMTLMILVYDDYYAGYHVRN